MTESIKSYLQTKNGTTWYEYVSGKKDKTIILIHGFIIPSSVWENTFTALAGRGYSVLRYDLYGRGKSAIPEKDYTLDFYISQLKELLEGLQLQPPYTLIGLSMGGMLAFQFYRKYSGLIERICLISPVTGKHMPFFSGILLMPGIGKSILAVFGRKILNRRLKKMLSKTQQYEKVLAESVKQTKRKGFLNAFYSAYRNTLCNPASYAYDSPPSGDGLHRTCLIWGTNDRVIPVDNAAVIKKSMPDCSFFLLENTGHCSPLEQPEKVNKILFAFLEDRKPGCS